MISRRMLLPLVIAGAATLSLPAQAQDKTPFTQAAFEAAQKAGKSILVDVSAPWCPTCKAQAPIIGKLRKEAKYAGIVLFNVDFDSQKDVLKALNVRSQSTLIGYKGAKETTRSTGDTNPMTIEDLLETTL